MPHYRQMSALYIKPPMPYSTQKESVFPKLLSPELNLSALFAPHEDMDKTSMSLNLTARHMHINLNKLRADFKRMRSLEDQIASLEAEKSKFTTQINNLIKKAGAKNKKATLESAAVQELIQAGNEIKIRENKILEDLIPLAEVVNVASQRLPNSLHYATLLLDTISSGSINDFNRFQHVIFDMNIEHLESLKNKMRREFDHGFDWHRLIDDSVETDDGVRRDAKYTNNGSNTTKWSFVKESSIESIPNNRYLVGTYARLEQALVDFVHDKIEKLNDKSTQTAKSMPNFEHVKSVSMFKSAVIEGRFDLIFFSYFLHCFYHFLREYFYWQYLFILLFGIYLNPYLGSLSLVRVRVWIGDRGSRFRSTSRPVSCLKGLQSAKSKSCQD